QRLPDNCCGDALALAAASREQLLGLQQIQLRINGRRQRVTPLGEPLQVTLPGCRDEIPIVQPTSFLFCPAAHAPPEFIVPQEPYRGRHECAVVARLARLTIRQEAVTPIRDPLHQRAAAAGYDRQSGSLSLRDGNRER